MKKIWMSAVSFILPLCFTALIHAAVPQTISYQGYLKDANGPVSGQVTLTFRLYDSIAANSPIWSDTMNVTPQNGIYSVQLGSENSLVSSLDIGTALYLGIQVGAEPEMSPRQQLNSVPYALRSSQADAVISNSVGTEAITDSSVTTAKIADGAVTDAQISGTISADKLDFSTVQKKYGKVAVVAQSGGDYTSPVPALANSAAWCGTPSADNPCLLKIMPGVYDLGAGSLTMQQYIDIEGSGKGSTLIKSTAGNAVAPPTATVVGANNAEIRNLAIRNTCSGNYSAGIINSAASPRISQVAITVTGGVGSCYGIYNQGATNVDIDSSTVKVIAGDISYGIFNSSSSAAIMNNLTVSATGSTATYGIYNNNSFSPAMNGVTVNASGATSTYGIYNFESSPTLKNVSTTAAGYTNSYAIHNTNASPVMYNVIAIAEGGTNGYGIYNSGASEPVMVNVDASALYGNFSFGMYNTAPFGELGVYTITADRSSFTGESSSILNDSEFTLALGTSKLVGPNGSTQTIQAGSDTGKGLIVKANSATQSANLQEWQNSNGVSVASVSAAGVLTGDGSGLSGVQKKPGRTVVVATSGGDYTSPITAMNSRASWCSAPSVSSPCLLKIMPGTYDLAGGTLTMQQYIDIEGSGELATIITSAVGTESLPPTATVAGASNAEIRFLAIRNTGSNLYGAGMVNSNSSPRMKHVSIAASGAGTINYGVYNGNSSSPVMNDISVTATGGGSSTAVHNESSSPIMNSVTASATGAALSNTAVACISSSPEISNSTFSASGGFGANGVYLDTSSLTVSNVTVKATAGGIPATAHGIYITALSGQFIVSIDRSSIAGSTNSILLEDSVDSRYDVIVGASKLTGPVVGGNTLFEGFICASSYTGENYSPLDDACL